MEVTQIMLTKIRFGFLHLAEKSAFNEKTEPKYSAEILIEKTDKVQLAKIEAAIKTHSDDFAKGSKGGKLPKDFEVRFLDGDDDPEKPAYAGYMYLNAKTTNNVGVFGTEKNEKGLPKTIDADEIKGGDYGNASIGVYAYKAGGIAFFLNGVQKVRDGEAMFSGGATRSGAEFAEIDNGVDADELESSDDENFD